uniref:Uncharacterized protein n=1 Tax=viral metagenome TaxID=1070528 RepID=A0A6C0EH91_9ZZZZ
MSALDTILINSYNKMVGFYNITNISGNTLLNGNATYLSNLNISGNSFILNSLSIKSNLYISTNSILNNATSILSNLYVSNNSYMNNININNNLSLSNFTLNSNLNINNNTILQNNTTFLSSILKGYLRVDNCINTSSVGVETNNININGNIINLGTTNSIVNFYGTSTYVATNTFNIDEKILQLNINASNLSAFDIGGSSGIDILGTSGLGFITTTPDAFRYHIQTPVNSNTNYILTQDINNNLYISGSSILQKNVSLLTSLYVSNYSTFNNCNFKNLLIYSNLNTNNLSNNSNINISNNSFILGSLTLLSPLQINSNLIINNVSINSVLNVSSISLLNNVSLNSSLFVLNNTILNNNCTINNNLFVNTNSIINWNTTILSSLNVSNYSIINGNITIGNNLKISSNANLIGNTSINSALNVAGNAILTGNNTIGSTLATINILGSINCNLPEYLDNTTAKLAGVAIGGFYRTGGALKIRLNDVPPTIYLSGGTSLSINLGSSYIDPGAYAIDYFKNVDLVYMTQILSGTSNLLFNNILISGTSTIISQTSSLSAGSYTATYQATDLSGNIGFNYRTLVFTNPSPTKAVYYTSNNIVYTGSLTISNGVLTTQQGTETLFTLNPSLLSTFNFNNNWTYIMRGKLYNSNDYSIQLDYDLYITLSNNNITNGNQHNSAPNWARIRSNGSQIIGSSNIVPTEPGINAAFLLSGFYIIINNNNNIITTTYTTINGNVLYQFTGNTTLTYINKLSIVAIDLYASSFGFDGGILYSTVNIGIADFVSQFGSFTL